MAAREKPPEVESQAAGEDPAPSRRQPEDGHPWREPHVAGLVWILPAQPRQWVRGGGWPGQVTVAQSARKAANL